MRVPKKKKEKEKRQYITLHEHALGAWQIVHLRTCHLVTVFIINWDYNTSKLNQLKNKTFHQRQ